MHPKKLRYFSEAEVAGLDPTFAEMLDQMRTIATNMARVDNQPPSTAAIKITSGLRKGDPGAHGLGLAVDFACTASRPRYYLLRAALAVGFRRIGVYDRHIHVDIADSIVGPERFPGEVVWHGKSG